MDASQLYRMLVFANVVEQGSLTAAATQLGISRSMVSQHLKRLESRCQQTLLKRTTRTQLLTQAGQQFYSYCAEVLLLAKQADALLLPEDKQLQGKLTIAAPVALGEHLLAPILADFHQHYPLLNLSLLFTDNSRDWPEQHIDVAIQVGQPDKRLWMTVELAKEQYSLVASPSYISRYGKPLHPDSLPHHQWLMQGTHSRPRSYQFHHRDGCVFLLQLSPTISCNTLQATLTLAKAGLGLAVLPDYLLNSTTHQGALIPLLPDYQLQHNTIYAVHGYHRTLPPRVRLILTFLQRRFNVKNSTVKQKAD